MSAAQERESIETWVIGACREIGLAVDAPGDDFFDAGGNSLSAMKLIARAEEEFGEDALPPDELFTGSSVREIAGCIQVNASRPAR
jgi:acyl carrier protein